MQEFERIKILFVAGFGPIVRDKIAGRNLYGETFNISFKEESGGYLHTEALKGVQSFALWPLEQAAQPALAEIPGRTTRPFPRHGSNLMSRMSREQLRNWNREAIEFSSRTRWNRGVRRSHDFFLRKGLLVGLTITPSMRHP